MTTEAKVLTANILTDGVTVYLDAGGGWTPSLAKACLVTGAAEQERILAAADEDVKRRVIVDPYLMDAAPGADGPEPVSQRERIRAGGPTVQYNFA